MESWVQIQIPAKMFLFKLTIYVITLIWVPHLIFQLKSNTNLLDEILFLYSACIGSR